MHPQDGPRRGRNSIDSWLSTGPATSIECSGGDAAVDYSSQKSDVTKVTKKTGKCGRTGDVVLRKHRRGDAGGQGVAGVVGEGEREGVHGLLWQVHHAPGRDALHEGQQ